MKVLAIETATEACSAALSIDGAVTLRREVAPRRHAELILPMCQALLDEAGIALTQLDGLGFGRGPGAFTGVRIATGVIQGMAFAADLPVVPVSTLAALAQQGQEGDADGLLCAIDARMGEVYWGMFVRDNGLVRALAPECVSPPAAVPIPPPGRYLGLGSGWSAYADALDARLGGVVGPCDGAALPDAAGVVRLAVAGLAAGEGVAAERALPVYLRDNVAKKKGE